MNFATMIAGMSLLVALPASAQETFYYPTDGQSSEQQSKDRAECQDWAKQQTGIDPTRAAPQVATAPAAQGQMVRGAGRGALLGVVGGAIGGDVGKGAAIGAGVGATAGLLDRRRSRRRNEEVQEQTAAAHEAGLEEFNRAVGACMKGRGYSAN